MLIQKLKTVLRQWSRPGIAIYALLCLALPGCSSLDWTGSPPQGRHKPRKLEEGTPQTLDEWSKLPRPKPLG